MTAGSFKLRGIHVLAMMLLFFGAVIAINIAFAVAAVQTFPGEDEAHSYTQGLHYNQTLAERHVQAEIGWQAQSELIATSQGAALRVEMRDAQGRVLDGVSVDGVLRWPPNVSGDRALAFHQQGPGIYVAQLGTLPEGRWDLRARAHDAQGRSRDFEASLTWPLTH